MHQFLRFSVVGGVNTCIGLLCIWGAMYFVGLNEIAANLVGYAIGLMVSFALNRAWTFSDQGAVSRSFPRWLFLAGVAYLGNLAIVVAAYRLGGINPYFAQPLGIAAYTAMMFIGARYLVFPRPSTRGSRPA